jgi:hypothetical protein
VRCSARRRATRPHPDAVAHASDRCSIPRVPCEVGPHTALECLPRSACRAARVRPLEPQRALLVRGKFRGTAGVPWSALGVPLRTRARAPARPPSACAAVRRAAPPASAVGMIRVNMCVYMPIYICARIEIQDKPPTFKFQAICTILHDTQHKHTAGTPALRCTHPRAHRRRSAAFGGGAPVVSSAAQSSCKE